MAVGTDTIQVYRGEAVDLNFTMAPVTNITGWTLLFTAEGKKNVKLIQVDGSVVSGVAGTFKIPLQSADTDIKVGTYQYDVWRMDVGSERVLAVGAFEILDNARLPEPV